MANIPIRDIPGAVVASPDPSNLIPMDNGSLMQKTTIANAVNETLPLSSQVDAEAGVDNAKRMSPLRTKQAIDAQVPGIVNVAITALNLGTMSQEDASDYTPTSGLAAVALSNDYEDLSNLPTLGTAAATDASDYATAAQGALASTAVQPGNAALVPAGGTTGQVLAKTANTDYAANWTDPEAVALPDGAVTTAKLANDALSADTTGRAKMADGFVNASKMSTARGEASTWTAKQTFQNAGFTTTAIDLAVGQIAFPATQNASSGVNTLDDYEESNTTPVPTASSGTFTTVSSVLRATKVGRQVSFSLEVTITDAGTASGVLLVTLPYSAGASFGCAGTNVTNGFAATAYCTSSQNTLRIGRYDANTIIAGGAFICISGTYSTE